MLWLLACNCAAFHQCIMTVESRLTLMLQLDVSALYFTALWSAGHLNSLPIKITLHGKRRDVCSLVRLFPSMYAPSHGLDEAVPPFMVGWLWWALHCWYPNKSSTQYTEDALSSIVRDCQRHEPFYTRYTKNQHHISRKQGNELV